MGPRDPILEFWDRPNISRTVGARDFKLGTETEGDEFYRKKCKIASKGVMWRSRDPILEFWDPHNISRTVGARNFKFGTETDVGEI